MLRCKCEIFQHRGEAVYALTNITRVRNIQEKKKDLEQENKSMQKSIEDSQAEAKDLNSKLAGTASKLAEVASQQKATHCALQWAQLGLTGLQRRQIKLECHSRRGKLKFFGVRKDVQESNSDTEEKLRNFMITLCL